MSDYADGIVDRAMQHFLAEETGTTKGGMPYSYTCSVCGPLPGGTDAPTLAETEMRHRLYAAVTETTEKVADMVRGGRLGVPVPEAQNDIKLFGEERLAMPKPKPGDPCPTCGTPMRRMADGSGECLSDHK